MSGSQGALVEQGSSHGLDAILVTSPHATAAISVFGGQLLSFRPTTTDTDVLWVSPHLAPLPTPLRGGIPLYWPYFSRENQPDDVPSHGYARTAQWALDSQTQLANGDVEVVLKPLGLEHLPLTLTQTIRVGASLVQSIRTTNRGSQATRLTEAFHNYFSVSDVTHTTVRGLLGSTYLDKLDDMNAHTQQDEWMLPPTDPRCDRVYPGNSGPHQIIDPGVNRVITLSSKGSRSTVVWNPGEVAAARMPDVQEAWRGYVCVETANVGPDVVTLDPGATSEMTQEISVAPLHI